MPTVLEQQIHAPTPARKWRPDLVAQRLALVAIIIAVWWIISLQMPHFILPGPPRVWESLKTISANGDLWHNLAITLGRVAAGFLLATAIGLPLGILLGANKRLGEFFEPIIPVMNSISSAIWAIFAIIWFGVSNATTIFVVFMTAMAAHHHQRLAGHAHGECGFHRARAHAAHAAAQADVQDLPADDTAVLFLGRAPRVRIRVARVAGRRNLGSSSGVGYRLRQAADLIQTDQVFAWTITLVVMMAALEMGVLRPLENHLFRWKKEAESA